MKFKICLIAVFFVTNLFGQKSKENKRYTDALWEVNMSYKSALPVGDLSLRYGYFNGAGLDIVYKTKHNYFFGIGNSLFFGRNVRDVDYVNFLKDENGYIFNDDGTPVFLNVSMRGSQWQGLFGKYIPIFKKTPQLALMLQCGAGFLQHRYLFSSTGALQFSSEYKKGYDRLSNGFAISQQIGINHFGLNRLINFKLGIEVTEAFTKNRRYYDYGTGGIDTKNYTDIIIAFKGSWVLPVKATDKKAPVYFK